MIRSTFICRPALAALRPRQEDKSGVGRRAVLLMAIAAVGALAGCGGTSVSQEVSDYLGRGVSCDKAGVIAIAGEREDFYRCEDDGLNIVGCFAVVDGELYDVSSRAESCS